MSEEQKAAYIFSQSVAALIELESMKVADRDRIMKGESPAYSEEQYYDLIVNHGIGHNDVIGYFRGI